VTKVLELKDERIYPLSLQPRDVGLSMGTIRDMAGFPPDQVDKEVSLLRKLLSNERRGGARDWVLLNAALLIYAGGKTPSISAAVAPAQQALDSGAAAQKLADLSAVERTLKV
jgi:anthranilate phosphoribosyltransferase